MTKTLHGIFDGKAIVPEGEAILPVNTRMKITVEFETASERPKGVSGAEFLEAIRQVRHCFDAETLDAMEKGIREHDELTLRAMEMEDEAGGR